MFKLISISSKVQVNLMEEEGTYATDVYLEVIKLNLKI